MTSIGSGHATPPGTPPGQGAPPPAPNAAPRPGAPNPGSEPPPPPAPDVAETAAALATADPQSFYAHAQRYDAAAAALTGAGERIREQLKHLEQAWQGTSARSFKDSIRDLNRKVDQLLETVSAPNYSSLLNQLGDVLADAQRQVGQVQDQQKQGREALAGSPAAANPAAQAALQQQETAHSEQSARVMQQLSNSYYNIGKQFREFPEESVRGTRIVSESAPVASEGAAGPVAASSQGVRTAFAGNLLSTATTQGQGSAEQGVLGRQASTYGTSAEPANVYGAELSGQGVLVPQHGSAEQVLAGGTGFLGAAAASKRSKRSGARSDSGARADSGTWTGSEAEGSDQDGSRSSGHKGAGGEASTTAWPWASDSQPFTESTPTGPVETTDGPAAGKPPATANAAPHAVEAGLVPTSQQSPAAASGGAPPPGAAPGQPAGAAASAPPPASAPPASAPPVSQPAVSQPTVSQPSVQQPSVQLPAGTSPSVSGPGPGLGGAPGTVAGTGASVPGAASTAEPAMPPASSSAAGGAGGHGGMPMMPMGGGAGMGGMGGQLGRERFSSTLQHEDEQTWDTGGDITGGVLGR